MPPKGGTSTAALSGPLAGDPIATFVFAVNCQRTSDSLKFRYQAEHPHGPGRSIRPCGQGTESITHGISECSPCSLLAGILGYLFR